ncbi:MAG TPA: (Fe-S)-binding protein [Yinghuangia sp.]|nr:(Fe-S)-binding protein [Yinghuangia sp.]
MRIALFITCFNDTLFPETGKSVVRLLRRLGHEVAFPYAQTCCGRMHFDAGHRREALPLARAFASTFAPYDVVVTPSASCAAMARNRHPLLARDADDKRADVHRARADAVAPRVFEFGEFLVDVLGVEDVGAFFPHTVAYQPTCHSARVLGVGDRPLRLLRKVRGLRLAELPHADECCGFGGTFALDNAETSTAMGADKAAAVTASGAQVLCAADNSCLAHIGGLLSRQGSRVRTMHLADILAATAPFPGLTAYPSDDLARASLDPVHPAPAHPRAGAAG